MDRQGDKLNIWAGLASVGVAAVLVAAKLWALGTTGSLAVAASLGDSALDLMVSLGGLAALRYAQRPPDSDHAFGHSSAEDLAALGQSLFILVAAGAIAWTAIRRLGAATPLELQNQTAGIWVMALSIVLTLGLVIVQTRAARRTGSRVVQADRLHYLGDMIPNIGAIAALWASGTFGLGALDSVVAIGAALMLAVGALRIGGGAWNALMDRGADPEMLAEIERLAQRHPGIMGFHDLKTRTAGSRVFVNIHVEIDGDLRLSEAHDIGAGLKHAILQRFPQADVIVHKDPAAPR